MMLAQLMEMESIRKRLVSFGSWYHNERSKASDKAKAYRRETLNTDLDRLAAIVVELREYAEEV